MLKIKEFISILVSLLLIINVKAQVFNVVDYGAAGNGISDDSSAFLKSWSQTCMALGDPTLIIPKGKTFLLHPITFLGPCKSNNISIMLSGTIIAPNGPKEWKVSDVSKWLAFKDISGLTVSGFGQVDGRGRGWWDISCRYHPGKGCLHQMPTAVRFENCEHVRMHHLSFVRSPQTHILVYGCRDVNLRLLNIIAPARSPNTDGIHISASHGVFLRALIVKTGDDCISIGDYTSNIQINDIHCGPGHGISIGSLGGGGNEVRVENITVSRAHFYGSTNGVRIKTWKVGRGNVQNIHFSNLTFSKVENPIIIDQYYGGLQPPTTNGVHIHNVTYDGAIGTSKTEVAINLNCSSNVPCTHITLGNIQLDSAVPGKKLSSSCHNAHGLTNGIVIPTSCLAI